MRDTAVNREQLLDTSNPSNIVTFQPGDYVIREKTNCDALYIIRDGQLEVFRTGTDGVKIPLAVISSGQYVGETALLSGRPYESNVVALTPVTALRLTKTAIDLQLLKVPSWLIALTKGLAERLSHANEIMRKNNIVDESLNTRTRAIGDKFKKASG